jgi:hypothetical protein
METSDTTTSNTPTSATRRKRKRGGQPRNTNAFKHGFYSRLFSKLELDELDLGVKGELFDEENILRILIMRAFESTKGRQMTHEEHVAFLKAASVTVGRIESLQRSRKAIYDQATTLEKALEELLYLPVEQD